MKKKIFKTKLITKYLVDVVEHDSWSGPKLLHSKEFSSKARADKYVDGYNSQNTAKQVPEYYITAEIVKTYQVARG